MPSDMSALRTGGQECKFSKTYKTARVRTLIRVLDGRRCHKVRFLTLRLDYAYVANTLCHVILQAIARNIVFILNTSLFIPTLDTTTKSVIMTI